MAVPDNTVHLGWPTSNDVSEHSARVTVPEFEAFLSQIRTVLENPAPVKTIVRARVAALVGPQADVEPDDWIFDVLAVGQIGFENKLSQDEMDMLRAELLSEVIFFSAPISDGPHFVEGLGQLETEQDLLDIPEEKMKEIEKNAKPSDLIVTKKSEITKWKNRAIVAYLVAGGFGLLSLYQLFA